jgi:hypothetical protein
MSDRHRRGLRGPLERFRAKWTPVRVKKTRQIKNLELRFDSIETEKALAKKAAMIARRADALRRNHQDNKR